jgi:rubredoxin
MSIIIAAIKSGTDPVGPLPPGTFHRWLEDPIYCPKCSATYNLVADYDQSVNKFFPEDSRRHLTMLRKAVFQGHSTDHRITHFETNGVAVQSIVKPQPPDLKPITPLIQ